MGQQFRNLLEFNNLSYSFNGESVFANIHGTIASGDRIGLVGTNGSGKTTLLKVLLNIIPGQTGDIVVDGKLSYVSQSQLDKPHLPVFEYLTHHNPEWWDVLLVYEQIFGSILDETNLMSNLSGGELVKLHIAKAFSQHPDVVLLDEPTNHLDIHSQTQLISYFEKTESAVLIASHNVDFLNKAVNKIWHLNNGNLDSYGGNYQFFQAQQGLLQFRRSQQYEVLQKKIKHTTKALQAAKIKNQKQQAKLQRLARTNDRSMPKIIRNTFKHALEEGFGSIKLKKEAELQGLHHKAEVEKLQLNKKLHLDLDRVIPKNRLLIDIAAAELVVGNRLIIEQIDFNLHAGDRVAILGDNGSGKSLFVDQLGYQANQSIRGTVKYGLPYTSTIVDQHYQIVDRGLSLVENLKRHNPQLNLSTIYQILGGIGFQDREQYHQKAAEFSGGYIARLALVMVTSGPLELLILDEPTNNLDIDTQDQIAQMLNSFNGALILISHDLDFVNKIGIHRSYGIRDKVLSEI